MTHNLWKVLCIIGRLKSPALMQESRTRQKMLWRRIKIRLAWGLVPNKEINFRSQMWYYVPIYTGEAKKWCYWPAVAQAGVSPETDIYVVYTSMWHCNIPCAELIQRVQCCSRGHLFASRYNYWIHTPLIYLIKPNLQSWQIRWLSSHNSTSPNPASIYWSHAWWSQPDPLCDAKLELGKVP